VVSRWSALLALQRATHTTLHVLSNKVVELGLTPAEINALANLSDGTPRTVSALGRLVGAAPTTLTSVLGRLEGRGLITRDMHPSDRRAVVVGLTPAGRRAARTIRQAVGRLERRALAGLDAEAIAGLRAGLDALAEVGR
jgi:MarR family transcriptional regulator, organic hydroperoxide resistance regulator